VSGTATGAFADKNVGTGKSIVVSGLSLAGTDAGNYSVGALSATANITARPLALSGLSVNAKNYDGTTVATFAGVPIIMGILPGDVAMLSGTASGHFATAAVGAGQTVTLAGLTLNGLDALNYALPNLFGEILSAPSSQGPQVQQAVNGLLSVINTVGGSVGNGTLPAGSSMTGTSSTLTVPGSGFGAHGGSGLGVHRGVSSINLTAVSGGLASMPVVQSTLSSGSASVGAGGMPMVGGNMSGAVSVGTTAASSAMLISAVPGVQLQSAVLGKNAGFVEVKSFTAIPVALAGAPATTYSLPQDTFVHAVKGSKVSYSAKQADGSPLPEWVRFNTATGEITLNPPAGLTIEQLTVSITAVDTSGNAASSNLQFKIGS
jgi:trimeric autotransporter adhesin